MHPLRRFVTHDKSFNEFALQQPDFVSGFLQLPGPKLGASAGLHANEARLEITEECQESISPYLLIDQLTRMWINVMKLHHVLCDIIANGSIFNRVDSPVGGTSFIPIMGTLMPKICETPYLISPHFARGRARNAFITFPVIKVISNLYPLLGPLQQSD